MFVFGLLLSFIASDGTAECRKRQRNQSVVEQSAAYAVLRRCKAIWRKLKCCVAHAHTLAPGHCECAVLTSGTAAYLGCNHMLLSAPSHQQCSLRETGGDELIIRVGR